MQDQPPPPSLLTVLLQIPVKCLSLQPQPLLLHLDGGTIHWVLQSDTEFSLASLGVPNHVSMQLNILA